MKRLISILMVFLMLFGLVACNNNTPSDDNNESESSSQSESQSFTADGYDLTDFRVIRASKSDPNVADAMNTLKAALEKKGVDLEQKPDSTADDGSCEILVGLTNREATTNALEALPQDQAFAIKFEETKIVIVAFDNAFLPMAVDYFVSHYLPEVEEGYLMVDVGESYTGGTLTNVELISNGSFKYSIVRSLYADDMTKKLVEDFATNLKTVTGLTITTKTDTTMNNSAYEILIGNTAYTQSANAANGFYMNEAAVQIVGNKIVIFGHGSEMLEEALDLFLTQVKLQKPSGTTVNSLNLILPKELTRATEYGVPNIPMLKTATYKNSYSCGLNALQMYFTDATEKKFTDYVSLLENSGFTKDQENKINGNRFVSFLCDDGLVHVSYFDYNKTITVIGDPLTDRAYMTPDDNPTYDKITDNTFAAMSLNFKQHYPIGRPDQATPYEDGNGNGESFIFTLEDGRFIIIDGGWWSDADALYNFMVDHNKRSDGIVIAAWFLSHCHDDHVGAFNTFVTRYGRKVTVEAIVANTVPESMYSRGYSDFINVKVPNYIKTMFPDAKFIKPYAGQILTFCDVIIEILTTPVNAAPNLTVGNNDCMVFRVLAEGKKLLFMNDMEDAGSMLVTQMYGSALKCDFFQVPHHGAGGSTTALQNAANPYYALWTTSQPAFEKRITGVKYQYMSASAVTTNRQLYLMVGSNRHIVADGKVEILKLSDSLSSMLNNAEKYTPDCTKR